MDNRVSPDALEARYGSVMAEAIREEIRRADDGGVVYFAYIRDLAVPARSDKVPAEFKSAA